MNNIEKLDFVKQAINCLFDKRSIGDFTADSNLADLGLDSLDVVELQMYYEEKTGKIIPDDAKIITVQDLLNVM